MVLQAPFRYSYYNVTLSMANSCCIDTEFVGSVSRRQGSETAQSSLRQHFTGWYSLWNRG
jgi:hypothetical protein